MTTTLNRWLPLVGVVSAIVVATSAEAQVRARSERATTSRQTVAFAPQSSRSPRPIANPAVYAREISAASARHAVPERLIWAVIRVESGFDQRAVSPRGARGLMQLMPETAALLGVRDAFNPRQNIDGGTRHLRAMMVRFRNDVRLAVAAYNAGEGPVAQYGGVPPYPETREYVSQVLRYYHGTEAPPERVEVRVDGVRRIESGNTVIYTNVAFGQHGTLLP
jgi:soluble lytic murein transglycosylase-like protein